MNPANDANGSKILEVEGLKCYFPIERGFFRTKVGEVRAVDDVTFFVRAGETLGLVGESGCGKTTLGRCILRLYEPTEGTITFRFAPGEPPIDVSHLDFGGMKPIRQNIQMVFQDPYSSLDPRMTVLDIIGEPLLYAGWKSQDITEKVKDLMGVVGLDIRHLNRYAHAFSGGQRQRIGVARALATNPKFIVADEAVSALDVSVQAQIINLFQDLQRQFGLTYLFISHNLSVVRHISTRVMVMYVGSSVELAPKDELFHRPRHPYTEALLSAIPSPDPEVRRERILMPGEVPNPAHPPPGCLFHPRCSYAIDACRTRKPGWEEAAPGHYVRCHRHAELALKGIAAGGRS